MFGISDVQTTEAIFRGVFNTQIISTFTQISMISQKYQQLDRKWVQ